MLHPTPDRLESYADGTARDDERAVLESHLVGCVRCQAEVEEWRSLFAALSGLPRLAPLAGFAERVLASVTIRTPWWVRVLAWAEHLGPKTTLGWSVATAFVALPVVAIGSAMLWAVTRPWLTAQGLLGFASGQLGETVRGLAGRTAAALLKSDVALWLANGVQTLLSPGGTRDVGAAAALFAVLTIGSVWVLYRNLFQHTTRESTYVSYSF